MLLKKFMSALEADLDILFVKIGWAVEYNGTEPVLGGSSWVRGNPDNNGEVSAFRAENGAFKCGIGRGRATTRLHIAFVAPDPVTRTLKLVGVYARAVAAEPDSTRWVSANTRTALLIPIDRRPNVSSWPGHQGMRRWAVQDGRTFNPEMLSEYEKLKANLPSIFQKRVESAIDSDQVYSGIEGREGVQRERLVLYRKREARLRKAKITQTLKLEGKLKCEVPRCGFDFEERYGVLGREYAHVHHLIPLSAAGTKGTWSTLADLAIVCANCHAMVHRQGGCRDLDDLIPL